jgi:hypothetical protein
MVCLDAQFSMFVDSVPEEERELAWVLMKNVSKAEYKGIAKDQLLVSFVFYSICCPSYMFVLLFRPISVHLEIALCLLFVGWRIPLLLWCFGQGTRSQFWSRPSICNHGRSSFQKVPQREFFLGAGLT